VKALPAQIQKVATVRNAKCPVIFTNNTVKDPLCFLSIFPEKKNRNQIIRNQKRKNSFFGKICPQLAFN